MSSLVDPTGRLASVRIVKSAMDVHAPIGRLVDGNGREWVVGYHGHPAYEDADGCEVYEPSQLVRALVKGSRR